MKKVLTYIHVAILLLLVQVVFGAMFVFAQGQNPATQPTPSIEESQVEQIVREYEFLKTQSTALVEQSTEQYEKIVGLIDIVLKVASAVTAVFIFIIAWWGWNTKKEMVEYAKVEGERFKEELKEMYNTEFKKRLKDTRIKFEDLENTVMEVEAMQKRLKGHTQSTLVLVGTDERLRKVNEVCKYINERDFAGPIVRYDTSLPDASLLGNDAIIVFGMDNERAKEEKYTKNDKGEYTDPQLLELVNLLKSRLNRDGIHERPIPLIVYVSGIRADLSKLDEYPWYVTANMPVTLVNTIYTTGYAFRKLRSV